jgi:quercetin dioxygenase-like cupin family protein
MAQGTSTPAEPTTGKLAGLDPSAVAYTLPEQYKWRDPTGAAGTNQVILHGDPTKPGLYVALNRFKPGNFSKPHFHPNDRFITVVKGTWWVATGNKADKDNMVPMPAGSFVTHFGKQVHWDGAKDEEAWVLIVGRRAGNADAGRGGKVRPAPRPTRPNVPFFATVNWARPRWARCSPASGLAGCCRFR